MKLIITLFFVSFIIGCNTQNKVLADKRKAWDYRNWKENFKERAFCLCLLEGYNNSDVKNLILENDKTYYDAIAITFFDPVLKPVIQQEVEQIKKDSILSVGSVAEPAVGKKVFYHCSKFYKSKRLDSIVKQEIVKWKRVKI